jgi:hypothetical protein
VAGYLVFYVGDFAILHPGAAVINYQSPNKKKGVAFKQQPLDFVLGAFPYMT